MESKAKLDTIIADARAVITGPAAVYRGMSKTGGYADPMIFVLVMAVITGLLVALLSLFGVGMIGAMAVGIGAVIMLPVFALIGSFIGAAIVFVIWKLMGSGESFETAYRCVAYTAAIYPVIALLGIVPYLGSVISVAWGMYLLAIASIEVHKLNPKTAWLVFGILGALMVFSNLSGEMAARRMASDMEDMGKPFEELRQQLEQNGEVTPGDAGRAMGEFVRSMNKAARENAVENEDVGAVNPSDDGQVEADGNEMTPEEAGKALGEFIQGFSEATQSMTPAEGAPDTTPAAPDENAVSSGAADAAASP